MSDDSEEACLVRPRSPSITNPPKTIGTMPYTDGPKGPLNNGSQQQSQQQTNQHNQSQTSTRGSQSHESESGDLIDYNDEFVMSQFHADAIKQAGFGKFQLLATVVTGLGLAGHAIQVYAVFYIIPSAELEFCILDNEKSWLGSITLLGLGFGAFFWGGLASRAGRRKTLVSCMAVSAVFSVIAAFMPTYGPFMMARFCSAAGFGGALPAASIYLCEVTSTERRGRVLAILGAFGVAGGLLAGALAISTVPETGQMVLVENKEHFSAWHRYLLYCTLPTIFAILGLFWLPESPRYLLENGREVETLQIYQKIYRCNRTRGGYSLTELELPGARHRIPQPPSVLAGMAQSIHLYFDGFIQIFNKGYLSITLTMIVIWTVTMFTHYGMTTYVVEYAKEIQSEEYNNKTITNENINYENINFNHSLDNILYQKCHFHNCTFSKIFLSHIKFFDCIFMDSEFLNVKTSRTVFKDSLLQDVRLIDTDLAEDQFINCTIQNTTNIRLAVSCDRDFEFNIYLEKIWQSNLGGLIPSLFGFLLISETVHNFGRARVACLCISLSSIFCGACGFLYDDTEIIWTAGIGQGLMLSALIALTILVCEIYPTPIRCTALGVFVCCGHLGALIGAPLYSILPFSTPKFAALIALGGMVIPMLFSGGLKDSCSIL